MKAIRVCGVLAAHGVPERERRGAKCVLRTRPSGRIVSPLLAARGFAPAIFAVFFVFAFAACGKGKGKAPPPCAEHTWGEWAVKTAPTVNADGEDEKSCTVCGDEETRTVYAAGTPGLAYGLINEGTAYRVRKGTVTSGAVVIPAFFRPVAGSEYLPVTEVGSPGDTSMFGNPSNGAFQDTNVTGVTFLAPSNITAINAYAFQNCAKLTSVTIPNSVTFIGNCAFWDCTVLTSVTIPNSVTNIEWGVFSDCTGLTSVTISARVTEIYPIFRGCTNLTSVTIPDSVTHIHAGFEDTGIWNNTPDDSIVYADKWVVGVRGTLSSISIRDGTTGIADEAFRSKRFESVTIPNSVTSIGNNAFKDTGIWNNTPNDSIVYADKWAVGVHGTLSSISIRDGTTGIADGAFRDQWQSLASVTIPNSVTTIGNGAFWYCTALASVTIGNGVKTIGRRAFTMTKLTSVTVLAATPPSLVSGAFDNHAASLLIYVPAASVAAYKAAAGWNEYADRIAAIR